jgi:hypothetical protein
MRDPQWAISELRRLADKVDEEGKQSGSRSTAWELRKHADHIQVNQINLVRELMKSTNYIEKLVEAGLLTQEESLDFSDGIFDQRSYR